jgi:ubiquinone/menaquinone biosynthesis C-methylase UbiE
MSDIREYWDKLAERGPDRSVMDHNDRLGHKIEYLTLVRDQAILSALKEMPCPARVLDFGCGSGNLSRMLSANDYNPVGVDISFELLGHTRDQPMADGLFVQYDGEQLPFPSNCFNACVTHEVLIHMVDDALIAQGLSEIMRVLKPGGVLIAVEQTRGKRVLSQEKMKLQRPAGELLRLFSAAGFYNKGKKIIRRGHFPLIYMVRCGLIPRGLFPFVAKIESLLGQIFKQPLFDYASMAFVAEKPRLKS